MKTTQTVSALIGIPLAVFLSSAPVASAGGDRDKLRGLNNARKGIQAAGAISQVWKRFTPQNEYHIGRAVAARIVSRYGVYDDDVATRYINRVGHSLALSSGRPFVYSQYRFVILDTEEVNALAVPGAYVFITRGMLRSTRDEDMLAAVLAHEIAHLQEEHGIKLIKEKRWDRLFKLAVAHGFENLAGKTLGNFATALGGLAGDYFETLFVRGYGKDLDLKADRTAVYILSKTGYDPNAMLDVLEEMKRLRATQKGSFTKTHPSPSRRIKAIRASIKEAGDRPNVRRERFRAALGQLAEG